MLGCRAACVSPVSHDGNVLYAPATTTLRQQHSRPFPGIVYITARRDIEHLRSIRHTCVSTHVRPLRKNVTLTPVIPSLSLSSFTPSLVLALARIAFVSSGTFRRGCEPHHETSERIEKKNRNRNNNLLLFRNAARNAVMPVSVYGLELGLD